MHTAFLLAAGLGTRLRPLTLHRPKPLMPVCGVLMLDQALALARQHGHRHVLVNAHHLWQQVAAWAEKNDVVLQVELPNVLGTGGGLAAAVGSVGASLTVINGDILCDVDLTALQSACPDDGAAMALRVVSELGGITPVVSRSGRVQRIGTVTAAEGEPEADRMGAGTHFTGIHVISRAAVSQIPAGEKSCVVRTAYRALVPLQKVSATIHSGTWVDIGTPATYLQANLDALDGKLTLPIDPWNCGTRGPGGSWVGTAASVEGSIEHSVVGAGATVGSRVHLKDCVVWDDVVVPPGRYERAIIYGEGLVLTVDT